MHIPPWLWFSSIAVECPQQVKSCQPHPPRPRPVIRSANVLTMDRDRPRAQGVAMSDGRIVGVGSNNDVETFIGPGVQVLDLAGSTVPPRLHRRSHPRPEQRHPPRHGRRLRPALHRRNPDRPPRPRRDHAPRASGCRASSSTTPRQTKTASCSWKTSTR